MIRLVHALLVSLLLVNANPTMAGPESHQRHAKLVVLVGASIGAAWKLPQLNQRASLPGYEFDYVGVYDFNKSSLIADLLSRSKKPDIVMIKECSTYFPGDYREHVRQVSAWVDQLRAAGVQPILVTTAPPGEPTGYLGRMKNFIKHVLGRPTVLDGVTTFNDWLKRYGQQQGVAVFDLEAALRRNAEDRWMKPEFDSGDHVHLNALAYDAVDRAFVTFLSTIPHPSSRQ